MPTPQAAQPNYTSLPYLLGRFKYRASPVGTVIDVGASDSSWSRVMAQGYPDVHYHLIEALPDHEPGLSRFVAERPATRRYVIAAAGDRPGEVDFHRVNDVFGGAARDKPIEGVTIRRPMTTIDAEIERHKLPGPYFMKLDTHGFERQILAGAAKALTNTAGVLIEVYTFDINDQALRFPEMCQHMASLGFRPSDFCDPMWRHADGALWQFDVLFEPNAAKVFQNGRWA